MDDADASLDAAEPDSAARDGSGDEGDAGEGSGDAGEADAASDAAADAGTADVAEEVNDCEEVGDECAPFSVACEGDAVVFCSRCGFELRRDACAADEVCEDVDGAGRCRPCEGVECPVEIECEPGERVCLDFDTRAICGAEGQFEDAADCPAGRRCLDGSCRAQGADTGAACAGGDVTCSGELCVCAEGGPGCGALSAGYCSTRDCDANFCDPSAEVCADFSDVPAFESATFCVRSESCEERGAACGSGLVCNELPAREGTGPVAWAWACWSPVPTIGEPCDGPEDCLGGTCRVAEVGGTEVSYCVGGCGASGGCPSHAECVQDPADDAAFVCLARGNNVDCPRQQTEPLRVTTTAPLRRFGGGTASVCYFAR